MKITTEIDKINDLEQKINFSIDLLEVAKGFCEINYDKASEMSSISTVIEILLKNQKELAGNLDSLLFNIY